MVKLLSVVKFREGVRMEMLSGKRVLDYLNMINEQNRQISVKLSAKMDKTASAVARLQDENFALKGSVHALEEEFIVGEAAKWKEKRMCFYSRKEWKQEAFRSLQMQFYRFVRGVVQYSPGMQMEAISMLWEKKTETYVSLRKR